MWTPLQETCDFRKDVCHWVTGSPPGKVRRLCGCRGVAAVFGFVLMLFRAVSQLQRVSMSVERQRKQMKRISHI